MPTRKLYYEDAHLKCFTAQVLSCTRTQNGWAVTLDATAFYPEGGGQAADTGTLGDVRVLDTREQGEEIVHLCDGPLTAGAQVEGCIDYGLRFARMQQHSGEHIVSGILHRRYGCHNTGFHMGGDGIVTVDFDVPFPEKDLPAIEAEANAAVWQDLPVRCWYPGAEELPTIAYRSKKALPWPVRLLRNPRPAYRRNRPHQASGDGELPGRYTDGDGLRPGSLPAAQPCLRPEYPGQPGLLRQAHADRRGRPADEHPSCPAEVPLRPAGAENL